MKSNTRTKPKKSAGKRIIGIWNRLLERLPEKIVWRKRIRGIVKESYLIREIAHRETAIQENVRLFGKLFLTRSKKRKIRGTNYAAKLTKSRYESGIAYGIGQIANEEDPITIIASLKLGFEKQAVVIESIQGNREAKEKIVELNRALREPWANYLLRCVEEDARRAGYTQIKIRKPETLYYYNNPVLWTAEIHDYEKEAEKIQKRMREMYGLIAKKMGYRKELDFFVKDL